MDPSGIFIRQVTNKDTPSGEKYTDREGLIEHQLAHRVIDPNGRAHNRSAHLPARKAMMQRRADYLDKLRTDSDWVTLVSRT